MALWCLQHAGVEAAQAEGMPITMTLEAGSNSPSQPLSRIHRNMLVFHDRVSDLKRELLQPASYDGNDQPLSRIVGVALDTLYDPESCKAGIKKLATLSSALKS